MVDLGGHDEVVAGEASSDVGRQRDHEAAPADFEIGVMAFGFRKLCYGGDKFECLLEVRELESPDEPLAFFDFPPIVNLFLKGARFSIAYRWSAGSTRFAPGCSQ